MEKQIKELEQERRDYINSIKGQLFTMKEYKVIKDYNDRLYQMRRACAR